jgi:PAS domain S-box-containing protein
MLLQLDANVLLEAFLSNPGEAVVGFGLDGAIFLWNHAAEALYGFSQAEVLGKSVACLLPLYELSAHEDLLQNPASTDSLWDAVAERLNRSGLRATRRRAHWQLSSLRNRRTRAFREYRLFRVSGRRPFRSRASGSRRQAPLSEQEIADFRRS